MNRGGTLTTSIVHVLDEEISFHCVVVVDWIADLICCKRVADQSHTSD